HTTAPRDESHHPTGPRAGPTPSERHDGGGPEARAKKSAERINTPRQYLAAARANGAQYWRTTGLDCEIRYWTVVTGPIRKVKPEATDAAARELDALLFTPQSGAVDVAGRGEQLSGLGRYDGGELNSVLAIAIDRAVANARRP